MTREQRVSGGGSDAGADGGFSGGPDSGPPPNLGTTIYDLQDHTRPTSKPSGSTAVVSGVVTAVQPPASGRYRLFIQDPRGGPYSGIYVYNFLGTPPVVGDLVTVEATVEEFPRPQPGQSLHDCLTTTELTSPKITINGHSDALVPAPVVLDVARLATPSDPESCPEEPEQWEGVLVEVQNVKVVSANPDQGQGDFGEFTVGPVAGGPATLRVNDSFRHDYRNARKVDDVFLSIRGVLHYEFGHYKLEPRSNEDLTFADGTHPGPVSVGAVKIAQIQDRSRPDAVPANASVRVENVYVTAVRAPTSSGSQTFWIQDPREPGPYSGIEVFKPASVSVPIPAQGDWVTVEGRYQEYPATGELGVSEIVVTQVLPGTPGASPPAPAVVTLGELEAASGDGSDRWEGTLIKVRDVEALSSAGANGYIIGDAFGAELFVWSGIFPYPAVAGQPFDSITGVVAVYQGSFQIAPRGASDYTGAPEACTDTFDNDIDGLIDCSDPDCASGAACVLYEGPIRGIQDPSAAPKVPLHGQVNVTGTVTGVIPSAYKIWIQDAESEWSGISVYGLFGTDARSDISTSAVQPGDRVRVRGTYEEHRTASGDRASLVSQIHATEIEKLGSGAPPAPLDIPLSALAPTRGEAYEGLLVRVGPVTVAATLSFNEYRLQGDDGSSVLADDLFGPRITYHYESGDQTVAFAPKVGQRFASVAGIVEDSFGDYKIEPRSLADFTGTAEVCRDAIENDLDGYFDCADPECAGDPGCTVTTTTIGALQADPPLLEDGYKVRLQNVYVTARDARSTNAGYFWVTAAPAAAAREGIAVFVEGDATAIGKRAALQVGQKVTVSGVFQPDYKEASGRPHGVTRILVNTGQPDHAIEVAADAPVAVTPLVVADLATLADRATAEPLEGVLLELRHVFAHERSATTMLRSENSTTGPRLWNRLFTLNPLPEAGQRWSKVVGVLHDFGDHYEIAPRSLADFAGVPEVCGNAINDDLDAGTDCSDPDCASSPLCTTVRTVEPSMLYEGSTEVALGQRIRIENLIVTALDARGTNNKSFWAQKIESTSPGAGIFAFVASTSPVQRPAIGTVLHAEGVYAEFTAIYGVPAVSEILIAPPDGKTDPVGAAALPAAQVLTVAQLSDPLIAELYEGMLVEVRCVEATTVVSCTSSSCFEPFWVNDIGGLQSYGLKVGSKAYRDAVAPNRWFEIYPAAGRRYGAIRGVLHQDRGEYELSPRYGMGDMSSDDAGCP